MMRNILQTAIICFLLLSVINIYAESGELVAAFDKSSVLETQDDADSANWISGIVNSFYINVVAEKRWKILLDGLTATLTISLLSAIFGGMFGGLICLMRKSRLILLSKTAKLYITIMRGTPVLVLLMIIFYIVFASVNIDPMAVAIIGFSMNFAAYSAEIYRAGIESINKGQWEAGTALGFSKRQSFMFIIFPQAFRRVVPVLKGEIINLVKQTSVVGYIAVQDLTKAGDLIRSRTFDAFFPLIIIAALYFLLSWLVIKLIDLIEISFIYRKKMKRIKT